MNKNVNTPDVIDEHAGDHDAGIEDITLDDVQPITTPTRRASKEDWAKLKEEVRVRTRLEDIIQASWDKRSPNDWWCSSPLRPGDSDPSFHIDVDKQVWKDFGLGDRGGDVFAFLQRMWGCSFIEVLKRRAVELNIALPSSTPLTETEQVELDERELVQTILTRAAEHYHAKLPAEMRAYLRDHYGFTDATIDTIKIGFDDGSLYYALKADGYNDIEMVLTGLFGNAEKDKTRFEGRITFPYWRWGKVVYFAARQTKHTKPFIKDGKDITPKYLKLKTGPTGDELSWVSRTVTNDHFWGEDLGGRDLDLLMIPEGMPDAISAFQAGHHVISPITVQFRERDQEKLLKLCKRAKRVVLVPDQEQNGAGMKGATKTCTFLCKHGIDARILVLPHAAEKRAAEAKAEQLKLDGATEGDIKKAADWKVDLNEWMRGRERDDLQALIDATPGHVQSMISALANHLDPEERDAGLRPIMSLIAAKPATTHDVFINLVKARVGGTKKTLQAMLAEQVAELGQGAESEPEQVHGGFALTDLGNAERLHHRAGKRIRYVPDQKCFLVFTGKRWKIDRGGHLTRRLAELLVKAELQAAVQIEDRDARDAVLAHWTRTQGRKALDNMTELLKDQPGVCIDPKQLDAHAYLVNFLNGTLDLKKRGLRPHDPADLLTKIIEHDYVPDAQCPMFMSYLEAAQPDPEVREWLHRRDGSFLTADTSDQLFVVHFGSGGTGKGTRYRVYKHAMGEYVVKAPRSVFESSRNQPHPTDKKTLAGRRLAYGSEISPYLYVDQINELTGEEDIQARGMNEDYAEFAPTFKLEAMTNKKPVIREDPTNGIWRRLRIVPWIVKFEGEQRDNKLFDKLALEAEGVLAWLVRGCYEWMDHGLTEPAAIMIATEEFAAEQDHITPFINEACNTSEPDALVLADDLFKARQAWNSVRNERLHETQKAFGDGLKAHGFLHGTRDPKTRATRWKGIKLRETFTVHEVPMDGPGLCVMSIEEEAEVFNLLDAIREQHDREAHRLRLLEAV